MLRLAVLLAALMVLLPQLVLPAVVLGLSQLGTFADQQSSLKSAFDSGRGAGSVRLACRPPASCVLPAPCGVAAMACASAGAVERRGRASLLVAAPLADVPREDAVGCGKLRVPSNGELEPCRPTEGERRETTVKPREPVVSPHGDCRGCDGAAQIFRDVAQLPPPPPPPPSSTSAAGGRVHVTRSVAACR